MWMLAFALVALIVGVSGETTRACDESLLTVTARELLTAHFDLELGAIAPGDAAHVGFQHLKTAEALFAMQAIAHDDFDGATTQFRKLLRYQRDDGFLPHIVYGPSVPLSTKWITSNKTYHPGPAFWNNEQQLNSTAGESDVELNAVTKLTVSNILAPPTAADIAWQIFRLSPYDTVIGGVSYRPEAVKFLCDVYTPLKKLQHYILTTRRATSDSNNNTHQLLSSHHPWETFSSLSPHWKSFLAKLKSEPDYDRNIETIPQRAKARFAAGAGLFYGAEEAVNDFYEPMVYLASCLANKTSASDAGKSCSFAVKDVEFNSVMSRSAHALMEIALVLMDHSSVCSKFSFTPEELREEVQSLRAVANGLHTAIVGGNQTHGMWNASSEIFDDAKEYSPTAVHSLRGFLPAYASELTDDKKMGMISHFLEPDETFHFFCDHFPAPFFACISAVAKNPVTLTLFNYFLQRTFTNNGFPGLSEYMRNTTRDMVCAGSVAKNTTNFFLAYDSASANAINLFEDGYVDSTLAAATFLNILLPAVTAPPSPDTPPIDHRVLTVIMCVELVVAFAVAIGCFLFSVYFVANRPRDYRRMAAAAGTRKGSTVGSTENQNPPRRSRSQDTSVSFGDGVEYETLSTPEPGYDLEESLLSEDEDHAYGSFEGRHTHPQGSPSALDSLKEALAAISPW